jgi:hypothetical protein
MRSTFHHILLCIILSAVSLPSFGQKNHYYAPREGRFSINFPEGYTITADSGQDAITIKAECYSENEYYLASYTKLPAVLEETKELTQLSLEFFKEAVQARELTKEEWNIEGHSGLAAYLIMTEEEARIVYRVIIAGDILYQLAYLADTNVFSKENAIAFISTFALSNLQY